MGPFVQVVLGQIISLFGNAALRFVLPLILLNNLGRANGGMLARFYPIGDLLGINFITPDVAAAARWTTRSSAGTPQASAPRHRLPAAPRRARPEGVASRRTSVQMTSRAMTASTWTKMATCSPLAKNSWISSMRWVPESGPYSVMIPLAAVPTRQVNSSSIIKDPKGF